MMEHTTLFSHSTLPNPAATHSHLLQRKCACGGTPGPSGECEECRKKREGTLQRSALSANLAGGNAPTIVHDVLRSPGQPLDTKTRAFMESRFGHDFSRVRVHNDEQAARSARAVNALAYAVGQDIVFGPGQYTPHTHDGRHLIAHELTHVVQQNGAAFQPGSALQIGAPDTPFERQAEAIAARSTTSAMTLGSPQTAGILQRAVEEAVPQTGGTGAKEADNPCAGWLSDPESTTKRAAEHYVRTKLAGDRGVVERIECDLRNPNGNFGCVVHFSDGTQIRVIVRKDAIIVGVYPLSTMNPPPDQPLCWYDYNCSGPNRDLVLTERKCQTSKPAGGPPSGNTGRGPQP